MEIRKGFLYTRNHEWVNVQGSKVFVGITDHAQEALGDIVFVDLPQAEDPIKAGESFAVVESVKAASDIYAPASGTILEVNEELADQPELINENPYEAWIITMELENPKELDSLMDGEAYERFCLEEV